MLLNQQEVKAIGEIAAVWAAALWGVSTLQNLVLLLTTVYTAARLYVLWRDKLRPKRPPPSGESDYD